MCILRVSKIKRDCAGAFGLCNVACRVSRESFLSYRVFAVNLKVVSVEVSVVLELLARPRAVLVNHTADLAAVAGYLVVDVAVKWSFPARA